MVAAGAFDQLDRSGELTGPDVLLLMEVASDSLIRSTVQVTTVRFSWHSGVLGR